ncbi:MAG: ATP-binding protein [Chlamydiales bacterium]
MCHEQSLYRSSALQSVRKCGIKWKFYQAEVPGAEATGLGLGLAVTKAIVELHHGQLEARNREEGGAEFSLILPLQ